MKKNENSGDELSDLSPDKFDEKDEIREWPEGQQELKDRSSVEDDYSSKINEFLESLISDICLKEDSRRKLPPPPLRNHS